MARHECYINGCDDDTWQSVSGRQACYAPISTLTQRLLLPLRKMEAVVVFRRVFFIDLSVLINDCLSWVGLKVIVCKPTGAGLFSQTLSHHCLVVCS